MGKEKEAVARPLWAEMFQAGIYKRNQGRIARQVTFFALAIVVAIGCFQMHRHFQQSGAAQLYSLALPMVLAVAGWWVSFRLVNMPNFADFLISVEAEMAKVSWPARSTLIQASFVVLVVIVLLAAVLFGFDAFWNFFFRMLGVI